MPIYALYIPDATTALNDYGCATDPQSEILDDMSYIVEDGYRITGLDYNLWYVDDESPLMNMLIMDLL